MNVEAAKLETSMTPPSALEPHPESLTLTKSTRLIPYMGCMTASMTTTEELETSMTPPSALEP